MSKVSFENNKVLIGRKVIKEFPRPIEGIVKTNTLIIVLLEYDVNSKIDLNVLAINKSGEEIWRIEPDLEADENNPYVSIQNDGTDLFKMDGSYVTIDLKTGKIIKRAKENNVGRRPW